MQQITIKLTPLTIILCVSKYFRIYALCLLYSLLPRWIFFTNLLLSHSFIHNEHIKMNNSYYLTHDLFCFLFLLLNSFIMSVRYSYAWIIIIAYFTVDLQLLHFVSCIVWELEWILFIYFFSFFFVNWLWRLSWHICWKEIYGFISLK